MRLLVWSTHRLSLTDDGFNLEAIIRCSSGGGFELQPIVQMPHAGSECTRVVWAQSAEARAPVRYNSM